jgi:hypothetical protein
MNNIAKNIFLTILIATMLIAPSMMIMKTQAAVEGPPPVFLVFPRGYTAEALISYSAEPPILSPEDGFPGLASTAQFASDPSLVQLPLLPGNTEGYYLVEIVSGSFRGLVKVFVQYDPADFPKCKSPRLCMGDPVDFNNDGKVNGQDTALMLNAIKSFQCGTITRYDLWRFDINHDGVVNNADFRIVLQFACFGIEANPGHCWDRLPWIDITIGTYVDRSSGIHYVVGVTDHFSVFGVR